MNRAPVMIRMAGRAKPAASGSGFGGRRVVMVSKGDQGGINLEIGIAAHCGRRS